MAEWRIKHRRIYTEHGRAIWYYTLERKKNFLFIFKKWKVVATEYYPTSDLSLEEQHKRMIPILEKRRTEILEDEAIARSESVVKEWN